MNGHTIPQSESIHSAMSIETNEDDEACQRDTARQSNGNEHTRRNGSLDGREGESAQESGAEDGEDDIYARRKSVPSLSPDDSKKAVVHGKSCPSRL